MKIWPRILIVVAVVGVVSSSAPTAAFSAALDAATEAASPSSHEAVPPSAPDVCHSQPPALRPDASAAPSTALALSDTVYGTCLVDCDDSGNEDLHSAGWMSYEECCSQTFTICPDGKPRAAKGVMTAEGWGQACFRQRPQLP